LHTRNLTGNVSGESDSNTCRIDLGAQGGIGAVFNELSIAQCSVAQTDGPTIRQRIVAPHGQDECIMTEFHLEKLGSIDGSVHESNVEFAVGYGPRQLASRRVG
jgi:hypothetical protein